MGTQRITPAMSTKSSACSSPKPEYGKLFVEFVGTVYKVKLQLVKVSPQAPQVAAAQF